LEYLFQPNQYAVVEPGPGWSITGLAAVEKF
jgi:hypothetical protein